MITCFRTILKHLTSLSSIHVFDELMNNLPVGRVCLADKLFSQVSLEAFAKELADARKIDGQKVKGILADPFNRELRDVYVTLRYDKQTVPGGGCVFLCIDKSEIMSMLDGKSYINMPVKENLATGDYICVSGT